VLGEGAFGIVYAAKSRIDNKEWAVKKIETIDVKVYESGIKEAELLKKLQCGHPNII